MAATAKSEQLQIRVSSVEKAEIQRRAKQAGLDMSGYVLSRVLPAVAQQFKDAVIACGRPEAARFGFADLNTLLTNWTAAELAAAVTEWPAVSLTPYAANYVAAMVELACARHGLRAPAWTREVAPLTEPAFASSLVSLRLHLLTHSPPVFRRRNIFVDSTLGEQI
jgi:hypothetical protein